MTTLAFFARKARAASNPMPLLPPVTTITISGKKKPEILINHNHHC